jgi:uncharacterized protein (TIGR04255 family)
MRWGGSVEAKALTGLTTCSAESVEGIEFMVASVDLIVYKDRGQVRQYHHLTQDEARNMADVQGSDILSSPPLIEAIFELKWRLTEDQDKRWDPNYRLLVGAMWDRLHKEYRHHEPLPAAQFPDELAAYQVQHRFRETESGWPLVQIGPGILSLNATTGYSWHDFKQRTQRVLEAIASSYETMKHTSGEQADFEPSGLSLRYINSVPFEFDNDDALDFIANNMKAKFSIDEAVLGAAGVEQPCLGLDARLVYALKSLPGVLQARFSRAQRDGTDSILWEIQAQSLGSDVPGELNGVHTWLEQAHQSIHKWFFEMIKGRLKERFA